MRKDRLYFLTFLSIAIIFTIIAAISAHYFIKASTEQLLDTQLESSKREAKEISSLVISQLQQGINKEIVKQNIQKSIEKTNLENGFISVFDWSGEGICHPDIKKVGQSIGADQSFVSTINGEITTKDFYEFLMQKQKNGKIHSLENDEATSEIVYLYPIKAANLDSDWIIGAHVNLTKISNQIANLRSRFYTILIIMGFVLILSSVITVRLIGSLYEKNLEAEKQKLEGEVLNLAKLNTALGEYQQKVSEEKSRSQTEEEGIATREVVQEKESSSETEASANDKGKKRILTYLRNELLSVPTEEIAYIYTENTITYVVDIHGKRSTTNSSLDELYSNLDSSIFYRANRQFIIAISAIDKIIRYGNNQLKILVAPNSEVDIIIGKNKASEFKQWLNM